MKSNKQLFELMCFMGPCEKITGLLYLIRPFSFFAQVFTVFAAGKGVYCLKHYTLRPYGKAPFV